MKLIVGLGNPGTQYVSTRHNIGFRVVEAFARKHRIEIDTREKSAVTGRGRVAGQSVLLAKPLTFMNLSGDAVGKLVRTYLESLADLIVVYDDVDLPVARLRLREGGSPGTHNGMKSIVQALGTEAFPRLRFGVRGSDYDRVRDLAGYVLDDFGKEEELLVETAIGSCMDALIMFVRGDLRRAMNEFNRETNVESEQLAR